MVADVRKLLRTLQQEVLAEKELDTPSGRGGSIPEHLATPEAGWLRVGPDITRKIRQLDACLLEDEHYEHLAKNVDSIVWEFVCKCAINRSGDHVKEFIKEYRREIQSFTLQFSVDHLTVTNPEVVGDVTFLPLPDGATDSGKHLRRSVTAACMAQVVVTGTDSDRATDRGRERARHALSVLRVSLANVRALHEKQLRFRLGEMYLIDERFEGFRRQDDVAYQSGFAKPLSETFPGFNLLSAPFAGGADIDKRITLALSWIDAAYMDASPIHRVGFLFTALEAMLGDSAEGLKAPALVFYRTALGHVVKGSFPDPNRLFYLYDRVRSYATHGEATPDVTEDDVAYLNWNIRDTLFELVSLYTSRGLASRKQVQRALLQDGVEQLTLDYLRSIGPQEWWGEWSPGPRPTKAQREQVLTAEVEALKTKVAELERQLAESQPLRSNDADEAASEE